MTKTYSFEKLAQAAIAYQQYPQYTHLQACSFEKLACAAYALQSNYSGFEKNAISFKWLRPLVSRMRYGGAVRRATRPIDAIERLNLSPESNARTRAMVEKLRKCFNAIPDSRYKPEFGTTATIPMRTRGERKYLEPLRGKLKSYNKELSKFNSKIDQKYRQKALSYSDDLIPTRNVPSESKLQTLLMYMKHTHDNLIRNLQTQKLIQRRGNWSLLSPEVQQALQTRPESLDDILKTVPKELKPFASECCKVFETGARLQQHFSRGQQYIENLFKYKGEGTAPAGYEHLYKTPDDITAILDKMTKQQSAVGDSVRVKRLQPALDWVQRHWILATDGQTRRAVSEARKLHTVEIPSKLEELSPTGSPVEKAQYLSKLEYLNSLDFIKQVRRGLSTPKEPEFAPVQLGSTRPYMMTDKADAFIAKALLGAGSKAWKASSKFFTDTVPRGARWVGSNPDIPGLNNPFFNALGEYTRPYGPHWLRNLGIDAGVVFGVPTAGYGLSYVSAGGSGNTASSQSTSGVEEEPAVASEVTANKPVTRNNPPEGPVKEPAPATATPATTNKSWPVIAALALAAGGGGLIAYQAYQQKKKKKEQEEQERRDRQQRGIATMP